MKTWIFPGFLIPIHCDKYFSTDLIFNCMNVYDDYEVGRPEATTLEIVNEKENNLKILRVERYDLLKRRAQLMSDFTIERHQKNEILAQIDEKAKALDQSIAELERWISNFKSKSMNILTQTMFCD